MSHRSAFSAAEMLLTVSGPKSVGVSPVAVRLVNVVVTIRMIGLKAAGGLDETGQLLPEKDGKY